MAKNSLYRHVLCTVLLAGMLISLGLEASAQSQINSPAPVSTGAASGTASTATAYEVVSIKPDNSEIRSGGWKSVPDGLIFSNMPLQPFVYSAYGIITDSQIKGLPGWAESEPYDIQAKVDADTAAAWQKMTWQEREKQQQSMNQALLADRCQFKAHKETRELPVYDLVIAKDGLKMKEAPADEKGNYMVRDGKGSKVSAHATSVEMIMGSLSSAVGRLVIDKTGLGDKKFDFELQWTPDDQRAADSADAGPSIFTALEDQLGLKLVPAKGPVEVLVIDRMEKPSAN